MDKRANFLPFFAVFFFLSLLLIFLGKTGIANSFTSLINKQVYPIRAATIDIFSLKSLENKQIRTLLEENQALRKQVLDHQGITAENKALKDQFAAAALDSQGLLPAKVIGFPTFIPGVSDPQYLIIDKGSKDGVRLDGAIIVGNYLVGKVTSLTDNFSKIELVSGKNSSFTAKITPADGRQINGIIKGKGDTLLFENVLLSENLKKEDLVLTKGDKDETGHGYPPDLIVGKIVSIEKKSTDLFQRAAVKSFLDFKNLEIVFVLK